MKIIGETKSGYIVSLENDEVAQLSGYSSKFSNGYTKPTIGSDISISTLIKRIEAVENLHDSLIALKDRLTTVNTSINNGIKLFTNVVTTKET